MLGFPAVDSFTFHVGQLLKCNAAACSNLLRVLSRWIFLAALAYAPWAYGCTTAVTIEGLNWVLAGGITLWIIGSVGAPSLKQRGKGGETSEVAAQPSARQSDHDGGARTKLREWTSDVSEKRRLPCVLVGAMVAILVIGWWMVANAVSIYDEDYFIFSPLHRLLTSAPGSVDPAISAASMLRVTLLLGVVLFVVDLVQEPVWLLRLWWAVAIAGGSIALLGLLQKATGAPMIFWQTTLNGQPVATFFAAYYYHANAGAYLNLVLPVTCGLALRTLVKAERPPIRALSSSLAALVLLAVLANTSRMAQLIGILLVAVLVLSGRKIIFRQFAHADRSILFVSTAVVIITLYAIGQASHLEAPLRRWQMTPRNASSEQTRWLATKAALTAVPDAGLFGFGPGVFRVAYPYYTNAIGEPIRGIWEFLHQDYVQTLLEWGWIGSAAWAVLFFGGIGTALRAVGRWKMEDERWKTSGAKRTVRSEVRGSSQRRRWLMFLTVLALGGIAVHALVDFPLQIASLQLYVATYLGVCWGVAARLPAR